MLRRMLLKSALAVVAVPHTGKATVKMPFGNQQSQGFNNQAVGFFQAGKTIIIDSRGERQYSGVPAANNLVLSSGTTTYKDSLGNWVLAGDVSYGPDVIDGSGFIAQQTVGGITTFYFAPVMTGVVNPWSVKATIAWAASFGLLLQNPAGNVVIQGIGGTVLVNTKLTANGGTAANPSLVITDTWHPLALINGWTANASFVTPSYRLDTENNVVLRGVISAAAATSTTFATLLAPYRPVTADGYGCGNSGGGIAGSTPNVREDAAGNLTVNNATVPSGSSFFIRGSISLDT